MLPSAFGADAWQPLQQIQLRAAFSLGPLALAWQGTIGDTVDLPTGVHH
jgi:hypothetical protein